jgi:hypothetical protein
MLAVNEVVVRNLVDGVVQRNATSTKTPTRQATASSTLATHDALAVDVLYLDPCCFSSAYSGRIEQYKDHTVQAVERLERLRCTCGAWSSLSLEPLQVFCDGVSITGPMPSLRCSRCSAVRLPLPMKIGLQEMTEMAKKRGTDQATVDVPKAVAAKPRFGFCQGVSFLYDRIDQQYIPGLAHAEDGFLTPVFFSKDILTYFLQSS